MIKNITLFLLLTISLPSLAQDFKSLDFYNSLSFEYLEKNKDINKFVEKNHKTYKNIRLIERQKILNLNIEDICYKIYFGDDLFKENKTEAIYCLEILTRQGNSKSLIKLAEIKIKAEQDYKKAAFYYGIYRAFSNNEDNIFGKIKNNLDEDVFIKNYESGLYTGKDLQLLTKNLYFKDWLDILIFDKDYLQSNNKDITIINKLENKDFNGFINEIKHSQISGSMILLLAQSNIDNLQRLSEFCFKLNDSLISRNCLQNIFLYNEDRTALNRFTYYVASNWKEQKIELSKVIEMLGFNFNDFVSQRLFNNILIDQEKNIKNIEDFIYYYNMGKIKRINYEKSKL